MWKKIIESIAPDHTFRAPVTEEEIQAVKESLDLELPSELAQLYKETNGVFDEFDCPLVWPIEQVIEDNLSFREAEDDDEDRVEAGSSANHLLFISDAGNGDLFGYRITDGVISTNDIYVWDHEEASCVRIASSLQDFVKGWVTGEIAI